MPEINKDTTLMVKCDCHGHLLEIQNDTSWLEENWEPYYYVTIWNQDPNPLTFKDRVKMIFRLIFGKRLDGGDVVLTKNDVERIVVFFQTQMANNVAALKKKNEQQ
jgi:hypothetical protein